MEMNPLKKKHSKSINCLIHSKVKILCAMESSSASSKRTRPLGIGNPTICCLVDGCASDLSKCRDYHRRHKVCELHSKTPKVTIGGQEQRFCQQCSRFHSLEEFDEGKRSCRKRLDGHNRRRRKPQAEPLSMNSARFFPSHQGNEYMNFRVPQLFPPSPAGSLSWGNAMKPENESVFFNIHPQSSFHRRQGGSFSGQPPPGKQFPIMEGGDSSADGSMCHQPLLSQKPSGHSRKMCPDELNQVVNTSRALSLLSSSPCQEAGQSCCIEGQQGLHLPSHHHSLMLHYGDGSGLSSYPCPLQHRTPSSLMLDDAADPATLLHCQEAGMFQTRPEPPPDNGPTHHTLSFSWD